MKMASNSTNWYNQTYIKFEIVKQLQCKYMSYAYPNEKGRYGLKRYFFGYSLEMLNSAFEKIGSLDDKKLYGDLAYWMPMQAFTWNISTRGNEDSERLLQKKEWNELKHSRFAGFDFAMDFDSIDFEHWQTSYKDCKKTISYLDSFGIPYSVRWSGSKGFHIVVKNIHFPKWKPATKCKRFLELAKYMRAKLKLKTIDMQIYDMDRVLKLPYTIDGKSNLVVLPLDKAQFSAFDPSMCEPNNVISSIAIKNRGLCERQGSAANVKAMLKEVF